MKKTFSNILISVIMVGVFAIPLKPSIEIKSREIIAKIEINEVTAAGPVGAGLANYYANKDTGGDAYSLECNLVSSSLSLLASISTFGLTSWLFGSEGPGIGGCIAQFFFYIWQASAFIASLAGSFLDFFIFYSINDTSYKNEFVNKGWALVRDVANIFFIVALLYVALKTILSLNVSDNKRLIGTIIIVALLINFSLFVTRVVIDASNVIAKIFYTSIVPTNSQGSTTGTSGERSISVGLVRKYNPQSLLSDTEYKKEGGIAVFIAVTVILIALTLYTAYIFFAVALLFLARVVGLWMSMIFAPLAFASHTVSFKIPGFGHEDFWPELFKNAFLAPIFVFFLYMIVLFLNLGLDIAYTEDKGRFFTKLMSVTIPFAILFVLLMTAKKLAMDYAGKIGEVVLSGAKMLGGVAGGMALGAAAVGGRAVLGQLGSRIANNSTIKSAAANSKFWSGIQKGAMKMESGSFDLRQVKIAGKGLGSLTGMDLGEGKKGGFKQAREDKVKARQKRAEELKVGEDEPLTQALHREEAALQGQLDVSHGALEDVEKQITGANAASAAAAAALRATNRSDANYQSRKDAADDAAQKVLDLRGIKKAIQGADGKGKGGTMLANIVAKGNAQTAALAQKFATAVSQAEHAADRNGNRSIEKMEDEVIRDAKNKIHHEDRNRANNFANRKESTISNIVTVVTGGSWKGNREASHKIRMGVKLDSSGKSAGH